LNVTDGPAPGGLEAARALLKHIAALEGGGVPLAQRLQMLDQAQERVGAVLDELGSICERSAQPLDEHAREVLEVTRGLASACASAYRSAAHETIEAPADSIDAPRLAPVLLKAMRYVAAVMDCCYKSYSRLPEGTWKAMHDLYLLAEREGVALGAADARTRVSVLDFYSECLLLALADPYRLAPGETDRVQALIGELRVPLTVSRQPPETRPTCHFVVQADQDAPPHALRERDRMKRTAATRVFDASAMVEVLRAISPRGTGDGEPDSRRTLASKLVTLWDDPPKRMLPRDEAQGSVAICVGVAPIASFVAHESAVDGEEEAAALRQGLTMPLRALPEDEAGHLIPIHEWAVINMSAGGVRVRRNASTAYPVIVGEIVGIRAPGKVLWRIGVTRWVTGLADGATEFGVQFFAEAVCAVWARKMQAGSDRVLALLVTDGEEHAAELLLATPGTYAEQSEYELRGEGFRSHVRATDVIERNARFELFRVVAC
jgi:hypothetical protein